MVTATDRSGCGVFTATVASCGAQQEEGEFSGTGQDDFAGADDSALPQQCGQAAAFASSSFWGAGKLQHQPGGRIKETIDAKTRARIIHLSKRGESATHTRDKSILDFLANGARRVAAIRKIVATGTGGGCAGRIRRAASRPILWTGEARPIFDLPGALVVMKKPRPAQLPLHEGGGAAAHRLSLQSSKEPNHAQEKSRCQETSRRACRPQANQEGHTAGFGCH